VEEVRVMQSHSWTALQIPQSPRFPDASAPRPHPYAAPGEPIADAIARHERTAAEFEADVPTEYEARVWTLSRVAGHRTRAAALRAEAC